MKLQSVLLAAASLAAVTTAGAVQASTLTLIPAYVGPNSPSTAVFGINDSGVTTGEIGFGDGSGVGFVRSASGVYTTFSNSGDAITIGRAINNAGVTTGYSTDLSGDFTHEYVRPAGGPSSNLINPNTGNPLIGIAQGVNSAGVIVGDYFDTHGGNFTRDGFILSGGTLTDLPVTLLPGGAANPFDTMVARGVNDSGEIVGWGVVGGTETGWIDLGGTFTTYNDPGATGTYFEDINNNGIVSGEWLDAAGNTHPFYFNSLTDAFTNINIPGSVSADAFGLNNLNEVVITANYADGSTQNFIFNPAAVPEPATWAMLLAGFAGLGAVLRARRGTAAVSA